MKSGTCSVGRASGQPRPMNGKSTFFPRNDGGKQIENLYFQSKTAIVPADADAQHRWIMCSPLFDCIVSFSGQDRLITSRMRKSNLHTCKGAKMIVYQFYAELEGYEPKIWRRFHVNGNISVARLGYIVMTMYEMKASHLLSIEHEKPFLTASGRNSKRMELIDRYGFPDKALDYTDDDSKEAAKIKVSTLNLEAPSRLVVWYDFGDDWRVVVTLEKKFDAPHLSAKELPRVLEGEGFGIVEDCGGIYGLADLAEAFKKKRGKEYKEYCAWLGVDDLDLAKFDLDDMNFRLKKIPTIFTKIYEQQSIPSQRSINLIERKYLQKP
ncbi:plasmid pRiA4b ORF-3 family protein [uncultured Desulfovibrio sp.]|uniref:plasmid pRiA4b ORF-3 family protein n=1 Tax=uncultured Desulfovibrio sp. TaxID=167968 RepID=UPI00263333B3|nr:plasmid pRiA4b ORF-3 family protein [uncultured Desulfovibrio sp.]